MFENCREFEDRRPYIVCEENRTRITFHNAAGESIAKIRIDGCVITGNTVKKCDWLLLSAGIQRAVFVELKGNKVMTAIEQLSATLDNVFIKTPLAAFTKTAFAVVTGNPFPITKIQNIEDSFNKRHKRCTLKVVKSPYACDFITGKAIK